MPDDSPSEQRPAKHLRVRVLEDGRQKVDLTLPAATAAHLADLMPPSVNAQGIDAAAIAADAAEKGFPPGDLFRMIEGTKEVRVWLE